MKAYKQIDNFYLEEDEAGLIKHILPQQYVDRNIEKNCIGNDYALRFLQNELNSLLNSFVNGGFSHKGYLLYPFFKGVSRENAGKIRRLKNVAILLNNSG